MVTESITSFEFVDSISSRYFPPNLTNAPASVMIVKVSLAYMNTSALASASCATWLAAVASSATPYTNVISHSGCCFANCSQLVCSHWPLSFDWSSEGDHTISLTSSLPPCPDDAFPQPPSIPAVITAAAARVSVNPNSLFIPIFLLVISTQRPFFLSSACDTCHRHMSRLFQAEVQ